MPLHRTQPRAHRFRLHHSSLEIQKLLLTMDTTAQLIRLLQTLHHLPSNTKRNITMLLLVNMASTAFLTHVPRLCDDTAIPRKTHRDFEEVQFKAHFKFRKQHFFRVLCALGLTASQGDTTPKLLRIGKVGSQSVVSADWALMVLLKRLASIGPYRYVLQHVRLPLGTKHQQSRAHSLCCYTVRLPLHTKPRQ